MTTGTISEHQALLARVPIFSGVSQRTLRAIARIAREIHHAPGHSIVHEGSIAHALHVVVSGTAQVSIGGRDVGRLGPGDFFGEMAVIDRGLRSATVTAETAVTALAVEGSSFRRLVESDPGLARHLLVFLSGRVRELDKRLFD